MIRSATTATNHAVTKDLTPDAGVQKIVKYWMDKWAVRQAQPLAKLDRDLDFSKTAESRTGNLVADLYRSEAAHTADGGADFALVPADMGVDVIAAGLKGGTVTFGEAWPVVGISPITTLALKGSTVEQILEQQWIPPAYGCSRLSSLAVSDQVRYSYDLGKPVGDRVDPAKVFIRGKRLEPGKTYRVATSAAMPLHGAQYGYPGFQQYTDLVRAPHMGQEVFLNHLRSRQSITAPALGRVTAIPGTPPPVDGPFGPLNLLPQSEMKATATSQGSTAYTAAMALDGNCTTMWHSNWSPHAPLPQYITLDLGQSRVDRGARLHAAPGHRVTERADLQVRRPGECRRQRLAVGCYRQLGRDGRREDRPLPSRYYGALRPADRPRRRCGLRGGDRAQYCSSSGLLTCLPVLRRRQAEALAELPAEVVR